MCSTFNINFYKNANLVACYFFVNLTPQLQKGKSLDQKEQSPHRVYRHCHPVIC